MSSRGIFVVAGLGDGSGTGAASARLFSKAGYHVALIARGSTGTTQKLADELKAAGGEAAPFPIPEYSYKAVQDAFGAIRQHWPNTDIRVALYNAGVGAFKPFFEVTEEDLSRVLDSNVNAAFAFARETLTAFKGQSLDDNGKRGTLIFTGATASLRGNVTTSAFATGKFALRALAQSLSKEFGKQNIHVAHAIIDGQIATGIQKGRHDEDWNENPDIKLEPNSIAKSYLYLAEQDRSAWTFELDLRPAHEKW
ncbi:NAD(P)-binding protein [Amylostereum chailletii]|nr:NAD(P)-binding protein [Amylostereum chailletii]